MVYLFMRLQRIFRPRHPIYSHLPLTILIILFLKIINIIIISLFTNIIIVIIIITIIKILILNFNKKPIFIIIIFLFLFIEWFIPFFWSKYLMYKTFNLWRIPFIFSLILCETIEYTCIIIRVVLTIIGIDRSFGLVV